MENARVAEVDVVHQVMKGDVRVSACEARQCRRHQAEECGKRTITEGGEKQVEPNYVRLQLSYCAQESLRVIQRVKAPAPANIEVLKFLMGFTELVGENCDTQQFVTL
jgi:ribosomal protein L44E